MKTVELRTRCASTLVVLMTVALMVVATTTATAQDDRLEMLQASFASANLQTRLEILRAAQAEDPAQFGPLYRQALNHVIDNSDRVGTEPMLRDMAMLSLNRIGDGGFAEAAPDVWRFFQMYTDTTWRIRALEVLGEIGINHDRIVTGIIDWVRRQHVVYEDGGRPDLQVLAAALRALGVIGDIEAFSVLVDTAFLQYPEFVSSQAQTALLALDGDKLERSLRAIRSRTIMERGTFFSVLLRGGFLDETEQNELARVVLADAMDVTAGDPVSQEAARQIRFSAAQMIRRAEYDPAEREVIRHFNQTVLEFERGRVSSGPLLEAIATVGAMNSENAARRLTEYLELVNTYTETDRPYDTQIVLAVIGNLESLGFPVAYNALFYTSTLDNYPRTIRDRSRQAAMSVMR